MRRGETGDDRGGRWNERAVGSPRNPSRAGRAFPVSFFGGHQSCGHAHAATPAKPTGHRIRSGWSSQTAPGHARPSMSLDVYSHVMPPDEVSSERFLALLTDKER
jgi:hypothetical protein